MDYTKCMIEQIDYYFQKNPKDDGHNNYDINYRKNYTREYKRYEIIYEELRNRRTRLIPAHKLLEKNVFNEI